MNKIIVLLAFLIAGTVKAQPKICGYNFDPKSIIHRDRSFGDYGIEARLKIEAGAESVVICQPNENTIYLVAVWHVFGKPASKVLMVESFAP